MEWRSAISQAETLEECVTECATRIAAADPDLALVFVSSRFSHCFERLPRLLSATLRPRHLVGCSGGGVIGASRECEFAPAVSVTAGWLPGVELIGFHLQQKDLPTPDAPPGDWAAALGISHLASPAFLLLCDPFSFSTQDLLRGLDYAYPRSTKVGGLASDAPRPGGNALFLDGTCATQGAVGMALAGDVRLDSVVAQGCRPVGEAMVITRCRGNLIEELDHREPLERLKQLLLALSHEERLLARTSLFLGIGMEGFRLSFAEGEFLIRNILGLEPETGSLAVGAEPRLGQMVQFHLRDRKASRNDLGAVLGRYRAEHSGVPPSGALLFSCLGRGTYLYGRENHDCDMFREKVGEVPLGGFFCNGEIGPVGDSTYLHGYTSCFALFGPSISR